MEDTPTAPSDDLDPVWKALSNAVRRAILDALRDGPLTTGEIDERFPDLSRFAIMQHLGVLGDAGLVIVRREGRRRYNHLNPVPIQLMHDRWVSRYTRPWTEVLVSLRDDVEAAERAENQGTEDRA